RFRTRRAELDGLKRWMVRGVSRSIDALEGCCDPVLAPVLLLDAVIVKSDLDRLGWIVKVDDCGVTGGAAETHSCHKALNEFAIVGWGDAAQRRAYIDLAIVAHGNGDGGIRAEVFIERANHGHRRDLRIGKVLRRLMDGGRSGSGNDERFFIAQHVQQRLPWSDFRGRVEPDIDRKS